MKTQACVQILNTHPPTHPHLLALTDMYDYVQRLIKNPRNSHKTVPIHLTKKFCLHPSLSSISKNWVSAEQDVQKQGEFLGTSKNKFVYN